MDLDPCTGGTIFLQSAIVASSSQQKSKAELLSTIKVQMFSQEAGKVRKSSMVDCLIIKIYCTSIIIMAY
jgi:hypothetical protein